MNHPQFQVILDTLRLFATTTTDLTELQRFCCAEISGQLSNYNWVGFYMLDSEDPGVLLLGPFSGAPTQHVKIPVSEGICGAAVSRGEAVIVDNVAADPRYLACSLETQSEIVVPIRARGKIVGEIDVDSHVPAAFDESDRAFLEECARIVGQFICKYCR